MLNLNDVHIAYDRSQIVNGVTFNIKKGDRLCLIGRNGVGKTTLLKGIVGLESVKKGEISLHEKNITNTRTFERSRLGIAYVPQGREIIPFLTVKENLILGGMSHNLDNEEEIMQEVLEYFPALTNHMERKGGVLSGGQQQQLAIARALMSKPEILILDEPSEGIQPNIVDEIVLILRRLNEERGTTIFIVEQNLNFAQDIADKFLIMEKGTIVMDGEFEQSSLDEIKRYLTI